MSTLSGCATSSLGVMGASASASTSQLKSPLLTPFLGSRSGFTSIRLSANNLGRRKFLTRLGAVKKPLAVTSAFVQALTLVPAGASASFSRHQSICSMDSNRRLNCRHGLLVGKKGRLVCPSSAINGTGASSSATNGGDKKGVDASVDKKGVAASVERPWKKRTIMVGPFQAISDLVALVIRAFLFAVVPSVVTLLAGLIVSVLVVTSGDKVVARLRPLAAKKLPQVTVVDIKPTPTAPRTVQVTVSRPLLAIILAAIPATVVMNLTREKLFATNYKSYVGDVILRGKTKVKEGEGKEEDASLRYSRPSAATMSLQQKIDLEPDWGESDQETVDWLNMALSKMWQLYRPNWEAQMATSLQKTLDDKELPALVKRVRVVALSLSSRPMRIPSIKPLATRSNQNVQYVARVRYTGLTRFKLLVDLNLPGRQVHVPVWISDVDLDAKMWFSYHMVPAAVGEMGPALTSFEWAFTELPFFNINIAPMDVQLAKIPYGKAWLRNLLTVDIPATLLYPKKSFATLVTDKGEVARENAAMQVVRQQWAEEAMARPSPLLVGAGALESKVQPMVATARDYEELAMYKGVLKVNLMDAKFAGTSWRDAFCLLQVGACKVKSKSDKDTSEYGGRGQAVWRTYYEFPVTKTTDSKFVIIVQNKDPMKGNSEIGTAEYDFNFLADGARKEVLLPIMPPESSTKSERVAGRGAGGVKGGDAGTIRLRIVYKDFVDSIFD